MDVVELTSACIALVITIRPVDPADLAVLARPLLGRHSRHVQRLWVRPDGRRWSVQT